MKKLLVKKTETMETSKVNKSDPTMISRPDRVTVNMSFEVFNGCWVGGAYESDVKQGETLETCQKRVSDFVESTVMNKAEEISLSNEEGSE